MWLTRIWQLLSIIVAVLLPAMAEAAHLSVGLEYDVRASSALQGTYSATNLIAPSLGSAWCEGIKGEGIGEWIELTLKEPIVNNENIILEIVPGYAKSAALFKKNGRPKKIGVEIDGVAQGVPLNLVDRAFVQMFTLTGTHSPVKKIRLKILDVYLGTLFSDTCISEIVVRSQMTGQHWDESLADKESRMLVGALYDKNFVLQKGQINVNSLEFVMRLADGVYAKGSEGGETLKELYLDGLIINPQAFVWVLDKQRKAVFDTVAGAVISPVNDKYSNSQIREAIKKGLSGLDQPIQAHWQSLLDAYSITMKTELNEPGSK